MFVIIEIEDGLTIQAQPAGMTAEDVAAQHGGILADAGPYATWEEANDALLILEQEAFDEAEAEGRI